MYVKCSTGACGCLRVNPAVLGLGSRFLSLLKMKSPFLCAHAFLLRVWTLPCKKLQPPLLVTPPLAAFLRFNLLGKINLLGRIVTKRST